MYFSSSQGIFQYDLTRTTRGEVINSRTRIAPYNHGTLQLGPDGKIYGAVFDLVRVSTIHKPDLLGVTCDFMYGDVLLNSRDQSRDFLLLCQIFLPL